jgi:hypothetical protein
MASVVPLTKKRWKRKFSNPVQTPDIDSHTSIDQIVEKVEYAIEQHASFLKVIPVEEIGGQCWTNNWERWEY